MNENTNQPGCAIWIGGFLLGFSGGVLGMVTWVRYAAATIRNPDAEAGQLLSVMFVFGAPLCGVFLGLMSLAAFVTFFKTMSSTALRRWAALGYALLALSVLAVVWALKTMPRIPGT
jgi:drug/metabolite transporter (DMT)-like permease